MYSVAIAFGLGSVMLCLGMLIRAKVPFFRNILMPSSVIGGIIGFILMNVIIIQSKIDFVSTTDFSNIVDVFFIMSFISIGLTGSKKKKEPKKKKSGNGLIKGATGMALIWCMLYAIQPLVGVLIASGVGKLFGMDAMYGILIPFAFCQGPGQSSTYGRLFESTYGFKNAEMVALTFAILGFIAAFVIGVPLARLGLKKGLTKSKAKINASVEKGYFVPEEQRENIGKSTFHSGNIETVAAHFAVMGICYLMALGLSKMIGFIPVLGSTFSAMVFMWGMIAAYIVRAILEKFKIDFIINNAFQSRITGFFSDYLVVCAFMAIQVGVIGKWIVPILVIAVVDVVLTYGVCLYFGSRLGSDHDFERVLGVYGTSTGTTPSGLSLVRIVDPRLQTTTGAELGMMNMAMIFSTPTMIFITFAGLKLLSLPVACAGMFATIFVYLILLKVFRVWTKPTFSLKKGRLMNGESENLEDTEILKGYLHDSVDASTVEAMIENSVQ